MEQEYIDERSLLDALAEAENAALHLRDFAAAVLRRKSYRYDLRAERGSVPIIAKLEQTPEGWLCLSLPVTLPHRKEGDRARYLIEPIRLAIRDFYGGQGCPRFDACVLAYEHVYRRGAGRRILDHDNVELKHCQDAIESMLLTNDSAIYCAAYQCTREDDADGTNIWILMPEQFPEWLKTHDCYRRCDTEKPRG